MDSRVHGRDISALQENERVDGYIVKADGLIDR